jgi:hypothetical protein
MQPAFKFCVSLFLVRNSFEKLKVGEEVDMVQIKSEVVAVDPALDQLISGEQ